MTSPPSPTTATGYLHRNYAHALAEFGEPRRLAHCQGWILDRPIPGTLYSDAMATYPLFCCQDWQKLPADLNALEDSGLVSLSLVTDPFGNYDEALLHRCFPDRVIPFKVHYTVRLPQTMAALSKHHRHYTRKALQAVRIIAATSPHDHLDEWCNLYNNLAERHRLTGIKAFSRESFARQLTVPGIVMLRALHDNGVVAAHLWYIQNSVAYSHLMAMRNVSTRVRHRGLEFREQLEESGPGLAS